jgi:hypothetical protein
VDALIVEAQRFADQLFVETDRATDLINNLLWLIQRPAQREAQRLASPALINPEL